MEKLAGNPFGTVAPPPGVNRFSGGAVTGVPIFLNVLFRTLIVGAAIYAIFNLLVAGYNFMLAGGDPKRVQDAWARIWQTIVGLAVTAGSFAIAGLVGRLLFGDPYALLRVRIFTP